MDDGLGGERGGEEILAVRRKGEGRGRVSVSHEGIHLLIFTEINDLYEAASKISMHAFILRKGKRT